MIALDPSSSLPPYEQIRRQFIDHVTRGELHPGDRIPTVRRLARDLQISPNTVARAYRELERTGAIETRGRGGSFITGDEVRRKAREAAAAYLSLAAALGLTPHEALALVRHLVDHPVRS
jgi:DNA-binding transcriptional regulator YhcF (GntR family)